MSRSVVRHGALFRMLAVAVLVHAVLLFLPWLPDRPVSEPASQGESITVSLQGPPPSEPKPVEKAPPTLEAAEAVRSEPSPDEVPEPSVTYDAVAYKCNHFKYRLCQYLLGRNLPDEVVRQHGMLLSPDVAHVLCMRICNACFAFVRGLIKGETLWNQAPPWENVLVSFSNVAATSGRPGALKHTPIQQTLGKSFENHASYDLGHHHLR